MRTILAILLLAAPALAFAADLVVHRDLPYVEPKNEKQTLDVDAPAAGQDRPANQDHPVGKGHPIIFWIHGGGWQHGDKVEVNGKPMAFVDKGFVFVSTNYRFTPDATIKQIAEDLAKAIRWTHDHAKEFGGDPDTIFVTGHSAGAQLAALVCIDERYLKAEGLALSNIKGCIPVDGDTYDMPLHMTEVTVRRADFFKRHFGDEQSHKELSSVTHVARGKGIPPFLILHVADHPETGGQSRRLAQVLQDAGVSVKVFAAEGTNHVKLDADMGPADDKATQAVWEFLDGILKK